MISENTFSDSGSAGAPTLTIAPPTATSERYASRSSFALTVLTMRSKVPASCSKVAGSLVAK